jgi:hypothetical protein
MIRIFRLGDGAVADVTLVATPRPRPFLQQFLVMMRSWIDCAKLRLLLQEFLDGRVVNSVVGALISSCGHSDEAFFAVDDTPRRAELTVLSLQRRLPCAILWPCQMDLLHEGPRADHDAGIQLDSRLSDP